MTRTSMIVLWLALASTALAQNAAPQINVPLRPESVQPGSGAFTMTVNGTGFLSASAVRWNGSARATTFVSGHQLTAAILASDTAIPGTAFVTVANPSPGGGLSNTLPLQVIRPSPSIGFFGTTYPARTPLGTVTADFNHDGNLDVAVANVCNETGCGPGFLSTVSVYLGKGDGTFGAAEAYRAGSEPTDIATADFDHNGDLDLAVTNFADSAVSILLGNENGTFQQQRTYLTGEIPWGIVVADLNRDGNIDVGTINQGDNSVSILLGNGDGSLRPHADYALGNLPHKAAVGDFNRDGKLDLASANSNDDTVSILQGNGDGTFRPQVSYATGKFPFGVLTADLNGDGKLDLATANAVGNSVSVLLGNGDGTFKPRVGYAAGRGSYVVVAGDFNGDNKFDLSTANSQESDVSVLFGNGDGSFNPARKIRTGPHALAGATGDLNRDGRGDLIIAADTGLRVLLQTSVGLSTQILTFRSQAIDTASPPHTVIVTNIGTATLTITSITVRGTNVSDFHLMSHCGSSLAPGADCTLDIIFRPTTATFETAQLIITDSAFGGKQSVYLKGTGR
jgi:hypothetical protein